MREFHIWLHGRPENTPTDTTYQLEACELSAFDPRSMHNPSALSATFEEAVAALRELPRMFIEPDGSFVWVGHDERAGSWQIDGILLDGGSTLQYAELRGRCEVALFDQLLIAVGGRRSTIVVQLVTQGVMVDADSFAHWLES